MSPEKLREIDEAAILGVLPDRFTVQALVAEIRALRRGIEDQRQVIAALKEWLKGERQ